MAKRLDGKTAIVTGAGTRGLGWGNGKATAVLFAREGAKVLLVDQDEQAVQQTAEIIASEAGTAIPVTGDVASSQDVDRIVGICVERFGGIDILHNNVGIVGSAGGLLGQSEEGWDRVFAVNVKSVFLMARAVVPIMVAHGGGRIINVSSTAARLTGMVPGHAYTTSKAAVLALTKTIGVEFASRGIRCNCILPGHIDTPMVRDIYARRAGSPEELKRMLDSRSALSPTGEQGSPWDVAHAALYLASAEAGYINGIELPVDGGYLCLAVETAARR